MSENLFSLIWGNMPLSWQSVKKKIKPAIHITSKGFSGNESTAGPLCLEVHHIPPWILIRMQKCASDWLHVGLTFITGFGLFYYYFITYIFVTIVFPQVCRKLYLSIYFYLSHIKKESIIYGYRINKSHISNARLPIREKV